MAKKTESTAVNDLINLVASQGPSVKDPGADLFSEPPKKGARMTATLSGAGTVEPLPRTRAPAGTQQNASVNPPVRVSTVAPRASSIPPIPTASSPDAVRMRPSLPPPRSSASMPRPPIPSSAKIAVPSSPVIAPPTLDASDIDVDVDEDLEADLLKTPVAHQPRAVAPLTLPTAAPLTLPTAAPLTLPTAAPLTLSPTAEPVYPRAELTDHPNAASDMTGAAPWFEDSRAVDRLSIPEASHSMTENTAQVQRSSAVDLLKKLALPMGVAIVLGVFVGGYIVFDGQGGKKRNAQPAATSTQNAVAAKTDDAVAPAVALPTEAKTDEAKTDEAKTEPVAAEPIAAEPVAAEPAKTDETKPEPVAAEPAKTEPAKTEPTKVAAAEPAKTSVLGGAVDSMPSTTTAPKVTKTFVDVRIDSTPSGATVMLVDRGKTSFLGTTPISASVDPSRSYDIVFTYANKPTQVEHLDPKATTRLAVTLGKAGNQSKEVAKATRSEKAIATAPQAEKKAVTEVKVAKSATTAKTTVTLPKAKVADPFADDTAALEKKLAEKKAAKTEKAAPVEDKAEKAAVKPEKVAAKGGDGVLMISSKPPCEIWVDGASTGLMTPQRAMSLPAGKHKITLVSPDKAHKKTIAVEISPDKPTKVIQDLLK